MKLLPFDRFTLVASKSAEETEAALAAAVRKPKWFRLNVGFLAPRSAQPYEGSVDKDGFKISPVIRYNNSFLPVIVGRFEPHFAGTKIEIVQRLHSLAFAVMAVWVLLVAAYGGAFLAAPATPEEHFAIDPQLVPVLLLAFFWAIAMGGFWWEARHTRERLSKLLDARLDDGF